MAKTAKKHSAPAHKERGTGLSIWLILIALHGVIFTLLIWSTIRGEGDPSHPWLVGILLLLSIVDVVAAIAIWYWKKWGYQLYGAATIVTIVVGLIASGAQLFVFYAIIPFAILGYLLKPYFDVLE